MLIKKTVSNQIIYQECLTRDLTPLPTLRGPSREMETNYTTKSRDVEVFKFLGLHTA